MVPEHKYNIHDHCRASGFLSPSAKRKLIPPNAVEKLPTKRAFKLPIIIAGIYPGLLEGAIFHFFGFLGFLQGLTNIPPTTSGGIGLNLTTLGAGSVCLIIIGLNFV